MDFNLEKKWIHILHFCLLARRWCGSLQEDRQSGMGRLFSSVRNESHLLLSVNDRELYSLGKEKTFWWRSAKGIKAPEWGTEVRRGRWTADGLLKGSKRHGC